MRNSLHIQLDRLASDRWSRRGIRILVRATWIALSLSCIGLGLELFFGWPLRWQWLAALAMVCLAGGALLVLRPQMRAREVAHRLDRRFQLNEQLSTALELPAEPTGVERYLMDQSRRTMAQLRRHISTRRRFPWADVGLTVALVVILAGLLVLLGIIPISPNVASEPLPSLTRPQDASEQFPEEPFQAPGGQASDSGAGQSGMSGPADPSSLQAIADALRDQSVTRPAADALDQGDLREAARSLSELADQAGRISPQARNELSNALRDAARTVEGSNPGLAEQLRESANGLTGGNTQSAAEALENLAEAIDQLGAGQQPGSGEGQSGGAQSGQGGASGQAGAGAGAGSLPGEQREQPSDRLGVDGVPLQLDGKGDGNTPSSGDSAQRTGGQSSGGGFTQGQANPGSDRVDVGDDPLRIPADMRDVVQDYFSP